MLILFGILGFNGFPTAMKIFRIPRGKEKPHFSVVTVKRMVIRQKEGIPPMCGRYDHLPHSNLIPHPPAKGNKCKSDEEKEDKLQ